MLKILISSDKSWNACQHIFLLFADTCVFFFFDVFFLPLCLCLSPSFPFSAFPRLVALIMIEDKVVRLSNMLPNSSMHIFFSLSFSSRFCIDCDHVFFVSSLFPKENNQRQHAQFFCIAFLHTIHIHSDFLIDTKTAKV